MRHIRKKLASQKGETLSEVMVAGLIGVMALLLLITMIMSATRMVEKSSKKMSAFYEQVSAVEAGETISTDKVEINHDINGEVKINYGPTDEVKIKVDIITATTETNRGLTVYKKK